MNKRKTILVNFYQSPKIPDDSRYKIDFLDKNDIYNPFADVNIHSSHKMDIDKSIIDYLSLCLVSNDLHGMINLSRKHLHSFSRLLRKHLLSLMNRCNIAFIQNSKYCYEPLFTELIIHHKSHKIILQCQLIGTELLDKASRLEMVDVIHIIVDGEKQDSLS